MEYREEEEDGDITAVDFDYWGDENYEFGEGPIIAKCGRLNSNKLDSNK